MALTVNTPTTQPQGATPANNEIPLRPDVEQAMRDAYAHLTPSQIVAKKLDGLPLGPEFKSIPLNGGIGSISFGHRDFLEDPEGPLAPGVVHDPNKSQVFYVEIGASTNSRLQNPPPGAYGPFEFKNPALGQCAVESPFNPSIPQPGSGVVEGGGPAPGYDANMSTGAAAEQTVQALAKPVSVGTWAKITGKVVHELQYMGSDRPAGAYLKLPFPRTITGTGPDGQPISVKGAREVYLGSVENFPDGRTTINGQFGLMPLHAVLEGGDKLTGYLPMLTGATDVGRGEPAFLGIDKGFVDKHGNKLPAIQWNDFVPDVPSHLVVIDQNQQKAFIGGIGGFIANGPFRGFTETSMIQPADALDQNNIKMVDGKVMDVAANQELRQVGLISGGNHPDPSDTRVYLDKGNNALYLFNQVGIAGDVWTLAGRIDMSKRAPIVALEGGTPPAATATPAS